MMDRMSWMTTIYYHQLENDSLTYRSIRSLHTSLWLHQVCEPLNWLPLVVDNESTVLQSLLVRLLHPKSSTPMLYQLSADNQSIAEVLRIDESHRSWFIGDAVVADGSLLILAPIHAMFLVLPYLIKNASVSYILLQPIDRTHFVALFCTDRRLVVG